MPIILPRVAFWLMPDVATRQRLLSRMAVLADAYTGPRFAPHVTLYSAARSPDSRELDLLVALSRQSEPLRLHVAGTGTTEILAKTLYLELEAHPTLTYLHQALHTGVSHPSSYRLDPHLSLLYQDLSRVDRERLVQEQLPPCTTVRCDELRAVAIPEQLDSLNAFSGWETLLSVRMGC